MLILACERRSPRQYDEKAYHPGAQEARRTFRRRSQPGGEYHSHGGETAPPHPRKERNRRLHHEEAGHRTPFLPVPPDRGRRRALPEGLRGILDRYPEGYRRKRREEE